MDTFDVDETKDRHFARCLIPPAQCGWPQKDVLSTITYTPVPSHATSGVAFQHYLLQKMTVPTKDLASYCTCDSCFQPSSAFMDDPDTLELSVHAETDLALEDQWKDEWNDLVCTDDMGAELTCNGEPLNCQEPSLTLDNPVDTDKWASFCENKHNILCCYRHIINSSTESAQNGLKEPSFNENDLQSLDAARQNLETLEDILRPYVKGWSHAEEQNRELLDYWYGKGVRPTQATQGDADVAETAGRALVEWARTYRQVIEARLRDPQSLEESVPGK